MSNNDSTEITVSTPGTIIAFLFEISIPFIALFIWVKFFKGKTKPFFIGMAGFICSIILENIFLYLINLIFKSIIIIFYIIAGICPGLFEETGRFICLRFFLTKEKDKKVSISYGIGHGGLESILTGINVISILILKDTLIKNGNLKQSIPFYLNMVSAYERLFAVILHISLSVIVYKSVIEKKIYFYIFAIIIHDFVDLFALLYQLKVIKSIFVVELILTILSVSSAIFSYKLYNNLKDDENEDLINISGVDIVEETPK